MDRISNNNKALIRVALLVSIVIFAPVRVIAGGIEVDGATNTTLDNAPNGVPIVNIANPNSRGLSHNKFRQFNVDPQGLILNNANQTVVDTRLGGLIFGNRNLQQPAKVILNEVTSTNPSYLRGFTEVAGQASDVVIANPNGISINGAGFINTPRVTLTTGSPNIDAQGNLSGFDVKSGEISIEGAGLDLSTQRASSIYTRYLNLNAKLHAQDLDISLGKNQIDYPGRKVIRSSKGSGSRLLLDSSALGGMYVNKIVLVGTDQGLGMKLPPEVIASSGEISISNDGRIVLQQLDATGDIAVQSSEDIESTGTVFSRVTVDFDATDSVLVSQGMVVASDQIRITTNLFENQASIVAGVTRNSTPNSTGDVLVQSQVAINSGEIVATNAITLSADKLLNTGLFNAANNLTVNAVDLENRATLFSGQDMRLYIQANLSNEAGATIFSVNDLTLAADTLDAKTSLIVNDRGRIQSLVGDIDIYARQFENTGFADIQYQQAYYDLGRSIEIADPGQAMVLDLAYNSGYHRRRATALNLWVNTVAARLASQAPDLYQANINDIRTRLSARFLAIEDRVTNLSITNPAYLDSGNNLSLQVDTFINRDAIVAASGDIALDITNGYQNIASSKSVAVTDYQYFTRAEYSSRHKYFKKYDRYSSGGSSGYIAITEIRDISSNTVTQAGGTISGQINGQLVNSGSGVLFGAAYQSSSAIDTTRYEPSRITLPTNDFGLFVRSTNPESSFLIETNPQFTGFNNFIGSSYLLDRLDFSANDTLKRLGDAFYESRLIGDSIFAQSGKRYLEPSIRNDFQQFQYLMDNALTAQRDLQLVPGVALKRDQINQLIQDIVWLEQQEIDGHSVLVPRVYLASARHSKVAGGQILAGDSVNLQLTSLTNSGVLEAGGSLLIDAGDVLHNMGGEMTAGSVLYLRAEGNIENVSGQIRGDSVELVSTGGDIINRRSVNEYAISDYELEYSTSLTGEAGQIEANSELRLQAAGSISVEGSAVAAQSIELEADSVDIASTTVNERFYSGDAENFLLESGRRHLTSTIIGEEIVILSTGATRLSAARLEAGQDLRIEAGNLEVRALNNSQYRETRSTTGNWISETVETSKLLRTQNLGSQLSGMTVVLVTARGDIELIGSQIQADSRLALDSAADIRIKSGEDQGLDESYRHKSGWFSGGALYSESEDLEGRVTRTAINTEIDAGSADFSATGNIGFGGVEIEIDDKFQASAQNIAIENAYSEDTRYAKHTRISVGFGDVISSLTDVDDLIQVEDGKLSLTIAEASYDHSENVTTQTIAVASLVQAGNISLNAGGSELDNGDITITGSDLIADGSIVLEAGGDVAILDAKQVLSSQEITRNGTAELKLTLLNEYDQALRAIEAVKDSRRDLSDARNDYDQYRQNLTEQESSLQQLQQDLDSDEGFIEQADVDELQRHVDRLRGDKEYYQANIALAVVTLTSKTTALVEQTARAATSSGTYGFNFALELDIEALERQLDSYYEQSLASNLVAADIWISAGKVAEIRGSNLQAGNDIDIDAGQIDIQAAENHAFENTRDQQVSLGYSWDLYGGRDIEQLGGSVGADRSRSETDSTSYVNAQLSATNVRLNAHGDASIEGANVHAGENLEISAQNLNVASVQDISFSQTRSAGLSYSGSGGGVNGANSGNETVQTLLTSLSAEQVDIRVGSHTEIKGAVIAAIDNDGNDNSKLSLSTNTLNTSSLINSVDGNSESIGVKAGSSSTLDFEDDVAHEKTKTLATLGSGNIHVDDIDGSDVRYLNTDIDNTEVAIYDIESRRGLNGELDTRLLSEEGRKEIAEDWLKTGMIGNTIELIVKTERVGIEDFFSETDKFHRTYQAVKEQVANDPQLAAMLQNPSLPPELKQQMLDQVTDAAMIELGFETHDNLIVATDETTPGGSKILGFYSLETGQAYINDLENSSTRELITTAGHEAVHAMDDQGDMDVGDIDGRDDNGIYASNFGENLASYTDFALGYQGYDGLALSNEHIGNSDELVVANTDGFSSLNREKGDYYCANSYSCYGVDTERLLKQAQTGARPIAILKNYQVREKLIADGTVVGYEAFNPETGNIIVMKPEELIGFARVVEAIPFVGFSLENMTIAEHAGSNAASGLHDDGYLGGVSDAWGYYFSDPGNYVGAVVGVAGAGIAKNLFRSNSKVRVIPAQNGKVQFNKIKDSKNSEEAFNYYISKIDKLDVTSSRNSAVFYSGAGNRELAEQFAINNGKVTLELTKGGNWLDKRNLFGADSPLTKEQAGIVWRRLSQKYAEQASGNVVGFVKGAKIDRIFNAVEYPTLRNNTNVTNIITGGE